MRRLYPVYIHEKKGWPRFTYDHQSLFPLLTAVRFKQGKLKGNMEQLGFNLRNETNMQATVLEVLKTSEIEGEHLDVLQVRSSVARHLGMDIGGLVQSDRKVEGVVEMMMNATLHHNKTLSRERLFGWHSALFPSGYSGMHKIITGAWRDNSKGPMQVVSGAMGKEKVHFEAPPAEKLEREMKAFLKWFNNNDGSDLVLKSALAHLWFVTIHPFDDGNGRIARALADMLLARSDDSTQRYYSMSAQIRTERKAYYEILEKTQKGDLDVTGWITWYLKCLDSALNSTEQRLKKVLDRTSFWDRHSSTSFNERQRIMINKLFEGFEGKLTSSKWAKICRCSPDSALRDIQDLVQKKILLKEEAGGRSTGYLLKPAR